MKRYRSVIAADLLENADSGYKTYFCLHILYQTTMKKIQFITLLDVYKRQGLFNAVSAGEYYPWFENSFNSTISGNRFVKTNFWTNSRGMFPNGSSAPNIVEITQEDLIIVGTATQDQGAFGSIEQIGYSLSLIHI